jgi:hypothetical protein
MRIRFRNNERGGTLMVTVLLVSVMGFMVAAYMQLAGAQTVANARSQAWNSAVGVMESGVEEALTHLYYHSDTDMTLDGWANQGGLFSKYRGVGNEWVLITISNMAKPVIYSQSYVRIPLHDSGFLVRTLQVDTRREALFTKGILAHGEVTLNGNNVALDSFDSTDPTASTNGVYISSKRKANGSIASNAGVTNIINSGNADIFGNVATGPGGTVATGPNGKIGDFAWQADSSAHGIQAGKSADDMNVAMPDITLPFTVGAAPPNGTGDYASYGSVISASGDWQISTLSKSLVVRSNVHARLLVSSSINLTGQDKIVIEPGGTLELYMDGPSAKFTGQGIINQNSYATNFTYWGTPSNTSVQISGQAELTGTIYAPSADVQISGGGGDSSFVGAVVANTVRLNGNYLFHYDESLARIFKLRGYIPTSWTEL